MNKNEQENYLISKGWKVIKNAVEESNVRFDKYSKKECKDFEKEAMKIIKKSKSRTTIGELMNSLI